MSFNAPLLALLCFVLLGLGGCVWQANRALIQTAQNAELVISSLPVDHYQLPVFSKAPIIARLKAASDTLPNSEFHRLHIYLEGDGRPWIKGRKMAKNPSSLHPLALKLMVLDKHPSLYLSRPCYGLLVMPENCTSDQWTDGRYSQKLVDTMNHALNKIKQQLQIKSFVLIGHSGGGSLAILMAANREDVDKLITIAPNVDHRQWTDFFGYLPLSSSLNPVDALHHIRDIEQWHFIGEQDRVVPASMTRLAFGFPSRTMDQIADRPFRDKISFIHYPDFNHYCCWEEEWKRLLALTDTDHIK